MRTVLQKARLRGVLVALLFGSLGIAVAQTRNAEPGLLRYNFVSDYGGTRLDPGRGFAYLAPNVFVGLYRLDRENSIARGVAERHEVSDDGLTYTFFLDDAFVWSDGTPLTAHDFEFGWKRALDPATKSVRAWMLYIVDGAEAYNTGTGTREDVGVTAIDDYTLEVRLRNPAAYFRTYMAANNVFFAQPKHVIEEFGDDWIRLGNVVFSGPFMMTEYIPNSLVVLERNPNWPLEPAKVNRVELNTVPDAATVLAKFQAGELDFAMGVPIGEIDLVRRDPVLNDAFVALPESRVMNLVMNLQREPWDNVDVRQAILLAIDQEELTSGPFRGVFRPSVSLRPPEMPGGELNYLAGFADADAARQKLADAGYPGGQGFPEVTITVRNEEDSLIAAEYLQFRLSSVLNIPVSVQSMETNAFLSVVQSGEGDIFLSAVFSLSPDLYDLYNVISGNLSQNAGYKDAHLAELLDEASALSDESRRLEIYNEVERYLVLEQAALVPLWVTDRLSLVRDGVVGLKEDQRTIWVHSWEYVEVD